jgi:hypothetical protein
MDQVFIEGDDRAFHWIDEMGGFVPVPGPTDPDHFLGKTYDPTGMQGLPVRMAKCHGITDRKRALYYVVHLVSYC